MKRLFRSLMCALLMLALLCPALPALGDTGLQLTFAGPVTLRAEGKASLVTKANEDGAIVYSLTDVKRKTVIYTETRAAQAGQEISWPVLYDDTDLTRSGAIKQMRASFVQNNKTYSMTLYYTYSSGGEAGPAVTVEQGEWYGNNTACSEGIAFRDIRPNLTQKWYHFTPVDLSVPGRQVFDYVASNMYVIGQVYLDVTEDTVTVSYKNYYADQGGNTETQSEFFTFFHDLSSVRYVEPEDLQEQALPFNVPLSIEEDLDGDTSVLLFVRNRVTYCDYVLSNKKLTRFWPNEKERKDAREALETMVTMEGYR